MASFFEVHFTPERCKKPIPEKIVVEDEVVLVLAPFNPSAKLEFTSTVNSCSSKTIFIKNPSSQLLHVELIVSESDGGGRLEVTPPVFDLESGSERGICVEWMAPGVPLHTRFTVKTSVCSRVPHLIVICNSILDKSKKVLSSKNRVTKNQNPVNLKVGKRQETNIVRPESKKFSSEMKKCDLLSQPSDLKEEIRRLTYMVTSPLRTLNSNSPILRRVTHTVKREETKTDDLENIPPCQFVSLNDFSPRKLTTRVSSCDKSSHEGTYTVLANECLQLTDTEGADGNTVGVGNNFLSPDQSKCGTKRKTLVETTLHKRARTSSPSEDEGHCLLNISSVSSVQFEDGASASELSPLKLDLACAKGMKFVKSRTSPLNVTLNRKRSPKRKLEFQPPLVKSLDPKSVPIFKSKTRNQTLLNVSKEKKKKMDSLLTTFVLEPISVPVIEDPFTREAVKYHTKEWMEVKEKELLQWLNTVLTPPEDWAGLSPPSLTQEDIAQLWEKVSRAKVQSVPSMHTLANRFHLQEGKWTNLKKVALNLFRSEEISKVNHWIRAQISKKLIEVKNEIDLSKNEGSKKLLVQMLLRYKPLWLRLGLETLFNSTIEFGNSYKGIIIFLQNNLFSNETIINRNKTQKRYILKVEMLKNAMNEYILEKFLMLIYFLDQGKLKKIIPFDPCLFQEDSPVKMSKDMLDEFTAEYLKCVGGMKNGMVRNGYKLLYKQSRLEEFDFSIKERKDLRDGVRLTKAMEIILRREDLTCGLKVPATTICHKLHNVDITFKALADEGFIIGNWVTPKDVVIGHYEKTLSLLWQILHKFIKPKYESAALKIQTWWRKKGLYLALAQKIRRKRLSRLEKAALVVQSVWKGMKVRAWIKENKKELELHRQRRIKRLALVKQSVLIIEARWKSYLSMKKCRENYLKLKGSVIKIQCWYRSRRSRILFQSYREKAILIQRWYRSIVKMTICKNDFDSIKASTILIQRKFRANKMAQTQRRAFLLMKSSAVNVQRWFRAVSVGTKIRNDYLTLKRKVIFIQQLFRANRMMKSCQAEFVIQKNSAMRIQTWYRSARISKFCRHEYLQLKYSIIYVQRLYRVNKLMRQNRRKFCLMKESTIKIQRWYRSLKEMQKCRNKYQLQKCAALKIQAWYRCTKQMQRCKNEYQLQKSSAGKIQSWYRSIEEMKKCKSVYLVMKSSAVKIQSWYRSIKLMQKCKIDYITLRSVIFIQRRYRSIALAKSQIGEIENKEEESSTVELVASPSAIPSTSLGPPKCIPRKVTVPLSCKIIKSNVNDIHEGRKKLNLPSSSEPVFKAKAAVEMKLKAKTNNLAFKENVNSKKNQGLREKEKETVSLKKINMDGNNGIDPEEIAQLWNNATRTAIVNPSQDLLQETDEQDNDLMKCMRKDATTLFDSDDMQKVLLWIREQISKKIIEVKDEIDLSRNRANRTLFVQMVFCYNPEWLRIGLETLCGKKIASCNYHSFIVFIIQNLMSNEIIQSSADLYQKKYYMNVEHLKNGMNEFIMEKFFLLVYFLDQAKTKHKIIPSEPPLFQNCSQFMSSQEVLGRFHEGISEMCDLHQKENGPSLI